MAKVTYDLSLSETYVQSWGIKEAIRELIQNAIDQGSYEISFDKFNTLTISNRGSLIPKESLILGNSTKAGDITKIGQFGEGYKLALLVLTREGKRVEIDNGSVQWSPRFKKSSKFNCKVLAIDEVPISDVSGVEFRVYDLVATEVVDIMNEFPLIFNRVLEPNVLDTDYGQIILDPDYAGKVYVSSLPIQDFEGFKYGYNFKPDVVRLDRDRKSVNLDELKTLTSQMVLSVKDFEFISENLVSHTKDAEYARQNKVVMEEQELGEFQDYLIDKFDVNDDSLVITKEDERLEKEIKAFGMEDKVVKVPCTAIKRILTKDRPNKTMDEIVMSKEQKSKEESAWWNITYEWGEKLCKLLSTYHTELSDAFITQVLDIMEDTYSGFDSIRDEVESMVKKGEFTVSGKNGR